MTNLVAVTLVDAFGRTTTKRFEAEAATVANAQTYTDALLVALANVSDLGHVKAVFEVPLTITVPVAAVTGANVDVGATLHTVLASAKGYGLKIPSVKLSLIESDGRIDIADEDVIAYVASFLAAGHWNVSDGEHIVSVASGELDK
jgi:hypothetical protein